MHFPFSLTQELRYTRELSTFYVASILLNMNRSVVDKAGVL